MLVAGFLLMEAFDLNYALLFSQDEVTSSNGQVEPPGMHMIYLPYSDDIRDVEEASMKCLKYPNLNWTCYKLLLACSSMQQLLLCLGH